MGREAGWAVGLLLKCTLWRLVRSQRPSWWYGGPEAPFDKALDPSQLPAGFALKSQSLLGYAYWLVVGMLGVVAVSSLGLFLQRFIRAQQHQGEEEEQEENLRPADPDLTEELMKALHLLDAMMEKMWRYQQRLERRQRSRRGM